MPRDYQPIGWDAQTEDDCRQLIRLAVREDLQRAHDWTTLALVPRQVPGRARVVARRAGVVAGLQGAQLVLQEYDPRITWSPAIEEGARVEPGAVLAEISGPARSLLTAERPMLNLLGHLCGIATVTRQYVDAVAGTGARIYDTRKTLPGWRRLEKYAVRCGGACNHRCGLFDGVLIKDNHLALGAEQPGGASYTPAEAVRRAREFLAAQGPDADQATLLIEIEVDSLEQLREVLVERPDVVLLDNMSVETLREAVEYRQTHAPDVELEASGGIGLDTVAAVARSGVDRISVGALTHSAAWFDVGLDWLYVPV